MDPWYDPLYRSAHVSYCRAGISWVSYETDYKIKLTTSAAYRHGVP
eukprot:SAG31_NODE_48368_length_192_cov_44.032258_1_plen_45_part_01